MSWRVIFTGAICISAAIVVGILGIWVRHDNPWFPAVSIVADLGIIFAGLRTVLDATKTANELRKMGLELEKLRYEIEEKKQAAEKEKAYVVVATLEQIEQYVKPTSPKLPPASPKWRRVASGTTAITALLLAGIYLVMQREPPQAQAPAPPSSHITPAPERNSPTYPPTHIPSKPFDIRPPSPDIRPRSPDLAQMERQHQLYCVGDHSRGILSIRSNSQDFFLHDLRWFVPPPSRTQSGNFIELQDFRIVLVSWSRGKTRKIPLRPTWPKIFSSRSASEYDHEAPYSIQFHSNGYVPNASETAEFRVEGKILNLKNEGPNQSLTFEVGASTTLGLHCH